jgi:GxxExxY protein
VTEDEISYKVIGIAINLHRHLGSGLLESAYETALEHDLKEAGFDVKRQLNVPYVYKGIFLGVAYRMDLLINDLVLIEVKSVDILDEVYFHQTLTYLRLSGKKLGLLINFNVKALKSGLHRIVNQL